MTQMIQEEDIVKVIKADEKKVKLSQKELCTMFDVSKRTVARWCKKGMPHTRNEHIPEFWLNEVEDWMLLQSQNIANPWSAKLDKAK